MDFARATITRDIFIPGPTRPRLSQNRQNTQSSKFHLTLSRAHRAHFFLTRNMQNKRDILSEKRESGMALKKLEFTPESGTVDTYAYEMRLVQ